MKKIVCSIAILVGVWGAPSWALEQAPAGVEAAVQDAVKTPPGSAQFFKAAEEALAEWVKKSPSQAFEWVQSHPVANPRRHHLTLVVMKLWVKQDRQAAVDYVLKLPGNRGLSELTNAWAAQDPASASAWAAKQPKERWSVVIPGVGEPWAKLDPKAAAAWISSLPADQGNYGYAMTAATWAWADPDAAATWVGKLPEGEARNKAASFMAGVWTRKKPEDAQKVQEWLKGITTPVAKKE